MTGQELKGHLDLLLLAVLEGGPAHGYGVIAALRERSGETFDLPEGTVYPALHRLEEQGLLGSRWSSVEGRRRRLERVHLLRRGGLVAPRHAVVDEGVRGVGVGRGRREGVDEEPLRVRDRVVVETHPPVMDLSRVEAGLQLVEGHERRAAAVGESQRRRDAGLVNGRPEVFHLALQAHETPPEGRPSE